MSKLITGQNLKKLILEHCKPAVVRSQNYGWYDSDTRTYKNGFFTVVHPLHVFKKVFYRFKNGAAGTAIANLIIPAGAMIYVDNAAWDTNTTMSVRKMRASEAYVHSVVAKRSKKQLGSAFSAHDPDFIYTPGSIVKPTLKFSKQEDQCDSGIHFFVNLNDAKDW